MNIVLILLIAFMASFLLAWALWRFPVQYLLDHAGDRSLHAGVVPRSGGIAILFAFALACVMIEINFFTPLVLASFALLCVVSLWDDVISLSQT